MRLIPRVNLKVEPRASSPDTAAAGDSVPGSTPLTVGVRGIPRVCREGYIPRGVPASLPTWVYIYRVYQPPYLPGYTPPRVSSYVPPWVYALGYVHPYVPPWVYTT